MYNKLKAIFLTFFFVVFFTGTGYAVIGSQQQASNFEMSFAPFGVKMMSSYQVDRVRH